MSTFNPGTCVSSVCPGGGVPVALVCGYPCIFLKCFHWSTPPHGSHWYCCNPIVGTPIDRPVDKLPAIQRVSWLWGQCRCGESSMIFNGPYLVFWHFAKLAVASVCFWQVIPEAGLIGVEWRMIFDGSLMELHHEDLVWNIVMPNTCLIWKLQHIIGHGRVKKLQILVMAFSRFFAVLQPLEELVWPEMPFAPPESDYGDNETMEHLGQFRQEQFRDTSVCPSGASGSSSQAGQMAGYVCGDTPT